MLVLSRKVGEKIMIGEGIELMVVAVNGNRVRLGIAAPLECRIIRAECSTSERKDERTTQSPQVQVLLMDEDVLASCAS